MNNKYAKFEKVAEEYKAIAGSIEVLAKGLSEEDPVRLYIEEIASEVPLTQSEEEEIIRKLGEAENKEAAELQNQLVRSYAGMVAYIAMGYSDLGIDTVRLIHRGGRGLERAVKWFNREEIDVSFAIYAAYHISESIRYYISNAVDRIKLSAEMEAFTNKIVEAYERLVNGSDRTVAAAEIAAEIGCHQEEVEAYYDALIAGLSSACEELEAEREQEIIETEREYKEQLIAYLGMMTEKEQRVLRAYFGLDGEGAKSIKEIAEIFGIEQNQFEKILNKFSRKMRTGHRSNRKLKDYLD